MFKIWKPAFVDGGGLRHICLGSLMSIGVLGSVDAGAQLAKTTGGPATLGDHVTPYLSRVQQEAGFIIEDVAGTSGAGIPVTIRLPASFSGSLGQTPAPGFILFRGLPDAIQLSTGFRTKSSWAVSLKDVPRLELLAPAGYRGSHLVDVVLHMGEAAAPVTRRFSVNLQPRDVSTGGETTGALQSIAGLATSAPPRPNIGDPPPAKRLGEAEATAILDKGHALLESGNLASARMLFKALARQGDARGAFAMGQSYDPEFLKTVIVVGLTPDIQAARQWYGIAAELGSKDAGRRLGGLSSRAGE
jgi:hypothetical protein